MDVEKMLREIPKFREMTVDTVLFESTYPVLFTCKNNHDIYMMICHTANSQKIGWIGTKTTYENLIDLLENRITIRDSFLAVTDRKIIIEKCRDAAIRCVHVRGEEIPNDILPTAGEYMDAEEGEYEEEIAKFKKEISFCTVSLQEHSYNTWYFCFKRTSGKGCNLQV